MSDAPDDALRDGLAAGRHEAFAALYDRYAAMLFRVAHSLVGSAADAEDAVQDVFVGLVRAGAGLARVRNLRAYLFAAVRRAAYRRAMRRPGAAGAPARQAPPPCEDPRLDRLNRTLRALPPEQRDVVALKTEAGLTFAEIAAVLGVSPNTAASRYRYALARLRAALGEDGP